MQCEHARRTAAPGAKREQRPNAHRSKRLQLLSEFAARVHMQPRPTVLLNGVHERAPARRTEAVIHMARLQLACRLFATTLLAHHPEVCGGAAHSRYQCSESEQPKHGTHGEHGAHNGTQRGTDCVTCSTVPKLPRRGRARPSGAWCATVCEFEPQHRDHCRHCAVLCSDGGLPSC